MKDGGQYQKFDYSYVRIQAMIMRFSYVTKSFLNAHEATYVVSYVTESKIRNRDYYQKEFI